RLPRRRSLAHRPARQPARGDGLTPGGDRPAGPGVGSAPRTGGGSRAASRRRRTLMDRRIVLLVGWVSIGALGCRAVEPKRVGAAAAPEAWSVTAWGERYEVF